MALILNIETSTPICSVALALNGKLLAIKENNMPNSHAKQIMEFVNSVIVESGKVISDIDAVAVSKGPGSYTGLRIGVSTAKGLCYAINKPLIAISTLEGMAKGAVDFYIDKKNWLFCPMIDARRMEVYTSVFDINMNVIRKTEALVVNESSFNDILENKELLFFGDGANKCKEMLSRYCNAHFDDVLFPSAKYMAVLADELFNNMFFEDIAYFEPFYLKDFIAGKPKRDLLKG